MIRRARLLASAALIAVCAAPSLAQTPAPAPAAQAQTEAELNRVVARIDGLEITEREVQIAREDMSDRLRQVPPAQQRDFLIQVVADLKLGARAAQAANLQDSAGVQNRLAYFRLKVMMDEFVARESAKAVTAEAARKLYDTAIQSMRPEEEVRARHILVEKEDEAKAALERIRKGEDFGKLAEELSRDPGSKPRGGDLGYFTQEQMVPQFAEMAFKLKAGEVSEPVQTQFGWHVLKVEDRRNKPLPTFEQVQGEINDYLRQQAQQNAVLALRGERKVERLDRPQ